MRIDESEAVGKKKVVVVGVRIDSQSRELLDWALVKVADPGDHVVALHVCRNSVSSFKDKLLLDGCLEEYEGICDQKQIELTSRILKGSSIRKVLVIAAKSLAAAALIVGVTKESPLGSWTSVAKYCAKKLPPTTNILAIHNGKVIFSRSSTTHLSDLWVDPRPSFYLTPNPAPNDDWSEFGDSETSEIPRQHHETTIPNSYGNPRDDDLSQVKIQRKLSSSSFSFLVEEFGEQRPGWPLLHAIPPVSPQTDQARKMSVVQWVMSLPNRSPLDSPQSNTDHSSISSSPCKSEANNSPKYGELLQNLERLLQRNTSECKWFSYEVLRTSTSQFSSGNLVGKGGSNRVYKCVLSDGRAVAVKVMKSAEESWKDFSLEVDIMISLKHKNITPLLGICTGDDDLISVYDFLSMGNLEENLHGDREKFLQTWEARFNVAVGIAEALNYLHNECPQPVIHRDVKSSNILLSNELEPLLSDFGLAIWGPSDSSSFMTDDDVVGTFGYLAPEYFMYGKVSEKIDVYSFGVVLLELLSGRKPISSETPKGQESLVTWAKSKLESGDLRGMLDPNLDTNADEVQIQRMALAARLCLTRAARLRPKMGKILKILKGEKDMEEESGNSEDTEIQDNNDDEVYPHSSVESHLGLAMLDVDGTATSFSSLDQTSSLSVEEYWKGSWSRSSSSFD